MVADSLDHEGPLLLPRTLAFALRIVRFYAIAGRPAWITGESFVVEETEPVTDAVLRDGMHGHLPDLRQPFGSPCEPLGGLSYVAGPVAERLFGI